MAGRPWRAPAPYSSWLSWLRARPVAAVARNRECPTAAAAFAGPRDRVRPRAVARAVAARLVSGHELAIDRSANAVSQAMANAAEEIAAGRMSVRHVAVEDYVLGPGELPFDIAFAIRVGVLDGRHPSVGERAIERIAAALTPEGRLFIDGGQPLQALSLSSRRSWHARRVIRSGRVLLVPAGDPAPGGREVTPEDGRLVLDERCSVAATDASLIETPACGVYLRVDRATQLE